MSFCLKYVFLSYTSHFSKLLHGRLCLWDFAVLYFLDILVQTLVKLMFGKGFNIADDD